MTPAVRLGQPRPLALLAAALILAASQGCVSPPIRDLPRAPDAEQVHVLDGEYLPFRVSPRNRYAIVMNGRRFSPPESRPFAISSAEDVLAGVALEDPWVRGDMDQLTTLLLSKGYDVYRLDFGQVTPRAMIGLLERLTYVSNDETRMFLAYSGEGDSTGIRTRSLLVGQNQHVIPPEVTVTPKRLFAALAPIRGRKALLINACEAGIFADEAPSWAEFSGVVIASCPKGYATTPHEPTGTTAIFAAFLELYADEPARELNLARAEIDRAGGLWTNLAHRWQNFWGGGLPLSYDPVVFISGDFWL